MSRRCWFGSHRWRWRPVYLIFGKGRTQLHQWKCSRCGRVIEKTPGVRIRSIEG